jgi:prenyltransferase beta subunit
MLRPTGSYFSHKKRFNKVNCEANCTRFHSHQTMTAPALAADKLQVDLHVKYIQSLNTKKDDLEYWLTEHLRLQGIYWGITALDLMNHIDALPRDELIEYVCACQHESGGFGGHIGHDPHIQNTLSAVQILATLDALDAIDADKVIQCKQSDNPTLRPNSIMLTLAPFRRC